MWESRQEGKLSESKIKVEDCNRTFGLRGKKNLEKNEFLDKAKKFY